MSFHTDSKGNQSSMRLYTTFSVVTGCYTVVISTIAMLLNNPNAVPMATVGAGMVVAAQGWKYAQKRVEEKVQGV